jgi:succinoglycan biosynthesis protein ExoA
MEAPVSYVESTPTPRASSDVASVSVVMPIVDEGPHLEAAVNAVLEQSYPRPITVVLAVGPSADDTKSVADRLAAAGLVRVVDNPTGRTAAGLNRAIAATNSDVVVRVDGHAELNEGYIARAVATLNATGADNVGGIQRAVGVTPMQQAIAAGMTSRFGVGDARFHYGGEPGPVDTVYLGVFRRSALERVQGYDESLVRNQDYELNWRLRATGGVVWFDPELAVTYRPRTNLRRLASQYHQYGQWKRVVLARDPSSIRWRQLVPPLALIANVLAIIVGVVAWRRALIVPAVYLAGAVAAAAVADAPWQSRIRLPAVFATMHHAWGAGFLRGHPALPPQEHRATTEPAA